MIYSEESGHKTIGMTGFQIKMLGIVLMVLDHVHQMFAPLGIPEWFTMLGRAVAPMFIFIAVEGFTHTRSKRRYLTRLLVGYWIMGGGSYILQKFLPLDHGHYGLANNIFGTLFISVLMMLGIYLIQNGHQDHNKKQLWLGISIIVGELLWSMLTVLVFFSPNLMLRQGAAVASMIFPGIMITEGGPLFIALAILLYLFKENRVGQVASILLIGLTATGFNFVGLLTTNIQWMLILSIIPILLYNGARGRSDKWFFYIFYPTHIWLLYILAFVLGVTGY